jgi:O-antigen/teichoic acid export membrane protein
MTNDQKAGGTEFLTGHLFARNAAFNIAGEAITFCIAVISVPLIVRRLGTDAFGILSMAWVVLGYMSLFDLGLARATTKFVAECISTNEEQKIPSLIWTSVSLQFLLGIVSGALLAANSRLLAERIFKIPAPLAGEARTAFLFLAIAVPMVLVTNSLRGSLEAVQRFNLINYIKIPTNVLMFSSPLLLIPFGGRLSSIVLLMTFFRLLAMLAFLNFCRPLLRKANLRPSTAIHAFKRLVKYGGWVTVSNMTGPLLLYGDRFAIGALLSVTALAYYTGAADIVNRTLVIPASLGTTLFPAFSSLEAAGAKERLVDIYGRALKYLVVVMGPVLLLVAVFSRDILQVWLGPVFARQSTVTLQILTLGVFINSFGIFPYSLLQGVGRPDVTAIFHLLELPIHLGLLWLLVPRMGITGAAIAVTVRLSIDAALIFGASHWLGFASLRAVHKRGVSKSILALILICVAMFAPFSGQSTFLFRVTLASASLVCYLVLQWYWAFDERDRQFLSATSKRFGATVRSRQNIGTERYGLVPPIRSSESE